MAGDKDTVCLGCGQKFKQKDASVKCTVCGLWSHKTCSGLTAEHFKCIAEQFKSTGRAYWACRACNSYAEGMNHRLREVEEQSREAIRIGQENEKELKKLREDMEKGKDKTDQQIEKSEATVLAELDDREARKKNIVVYGIEEASMVEGRQRLEHDKKELDKIFTAIDVNVSADEDVEFCRRVGEKGPQARPLVAGFFTEWSKSIVLKNSKHLANSNLENISIVPDLTQQQRKAERSLQTEADRRNQEELTNEDVSKNLEWRVVGKRGQKRLVKTYNLQQGQSSGISIRSLRGARGERGLLRPRARGRGWMPISAGQRKRGHPDQETEQEANLERPPKRGNRARGRPPGSRIATGANSTPVIHSQRPMPLEESIRLGEEEDENGEEEMTTDSQEQQETEEDPLLQGLRLGEL